MVVLAVVAVAVALVVVFAMYEVSASKQVERALEGSPGNAVSNRAFDSVVAARSNFSSAVRAYEAAVTNASQLALSGRPLGPEHDDLMELEREKDEARDRLLDAQRLWESVKPSSGPSSPLDLWFGTGLLRGWMFGFIGYERAFIRLDHAVDPSCWAVWKISRFRFGLGLGAEHQHLAVLASGADIRQLAGLISHGFDGSEVAFRPGFAPVRWYRLRTQPVWSRKASEILLKSTSNRRVVMWGANDAVRAKVADAFEVELNSPLSQMGRMQIEDSVLTTATSGTALIAGVWTGRRPHPHFITGSNHTTWRRY
jgi:hypothetical protein